MPDPARPPEASRLDLALARLGRLQVCHYQIPDPALPEDAAGICESDRHRWPCHASTLLGTLGLVLALTRDGDGGDLPGEATVTAQQLRAALTLGLLNEGNPDA